MKLSLARYLSIMGAFLRVSAIADFEYRFNFLLRIVVDIFWYLVQIFTFEVLFGHTRSISGWTIQEVRVFLGILFVVDAIWMILFSENIMAFSSKVRRGELDLLLAKPINAQFMVSLQRLATPFVGNLAMSLGWLTWALMKLDGTIHWQRVASLIFMIPSSILIFYSLRFLFSASALILVRSENISFLWYQLYKLGMRPDSIYPRWLRYLVLSLIPVGFVASVPARFILGKASWQLPLASWVAAIGITYLTTRYWKWALKFYSSASS